MVYYTDGSRRSGAGVFIKELGVEQGYALEEYSTFPSRGAELYAIFKDAEQFDVRSSSYRSTCICSDSQAALRAISFFNFVLDDDRTGVTF